MTETNKLPLVSIGVPIIKSTYLEKCLSCLLNQTYFNTEIIIINNAKSLREINLIEDTVKQFNEKRIKYFRNDQQLPIIENWNKTLFLSNGDFFAILCDDDFWEPDFIETMVNLSFKYPLVDIFHCRCLIINEKDNPINIAPICPEYEDVTDFIYHRIIGFRLHFLSDFLVRSSAIKKIDGFFSLPDGWGSDDLTWFRLSMKGGVAYSSKTLCHYRDTPVTVSNTMKSKNKIKATNIYVREIKDILNNVSNYGPYNSLTIFLILKQLKVFRKKRLLSYETDYVIKKFKLSPFFYTIVLNIIKIKYRIIKNE
jgi:glycosyltransferase involved in cell wall biosynthesis